MAANDSNGFLRAVPQQIRWDQTWRQRQLSKLRSFDAIVGSKVKIPYMPHSLTLGVLRILRNRLKDKSITDFALLACEVLAAHEFVYTPLLVIRRTIIYNHEPARWLIVSFLFLRFQSHPLHPPQR